MKEVDYQGHSVNIDLDRKGQYVYSRPPIRIVYVCRFNIRRTVDKCECKGCLNE